MGQVRPCPQCESADKKAEGYSHGEWEIMRCTRCDFVYLGSVPTYQELSSEFEWSQSFQSEDMRRKKSYPLLSKIDKVSRFRTSLFPITHPMQFVRQYVSSGRIIDLGCGSGSYLRQQANGFQLFGIDISTILSAQAEKVFSPTGGKAIAGPCHDGLKSFDDHYFDGVIMRSYLEHEYQPRLILGEAFRVLRSGGIVVVKVPNYASWNRHIMGKRWCGFRYPDHVNYFTPKSLEKMARDIGFGFTVSLKHRLPLDDNFWAVLAKP